MVQRLLLDASFDISDARISARSLGPPLPAGLLEKLDTFGFAILRLSKPPPRQALLELTEYFGDVWRHARSDADGVASIEIDHRRPCFLGTSAEEHPPHSDGAYSPAPPCLVVLSCEEATAPGGESILISGRRLYDRLRRRSPEALRVLFHENALVIRREAHSVTTAAFSRRNDRIRLVFRYDDHSVTQPSPAAREAFDLLRRCVAEPRGRLVTRLDRGDVLFIDNFGMLHGRGRFDPTGGRRRLLRLNFTGDTARCPSIFGFQTADGS